MIDFLNALIEGLSMGGVYALIALGYTMVYGIAKMLNFAHGDIIMVGGYSIVVFFGMIGGVAGVLISTLVAILLCVVLGIAVEKVAYKPLRGASPLAVLITAIGVSYLLQSLAQLIFGAAPKMVAFPSMGVITIGKLSVSVATIVTLIVAALIMLALTLFVNHSKMGRAMLAVSEDKGAATLMGVSVNVVISLTFAIGSALAAVSGTFFIMKSPQVSVSMGAMPGIKAFTAAVIGGIGSIPGAMLGGILLGIIESVCSSIPVLTPYTVAIEFALLIFILIVKPTGLLGKKKREKV